MSRAKEDPLSGGLVTSIFVVRFLFSCTRDDRIQGRWQYAHGSCDGEIRPASKMKGMTECKVIAFLLFEPLNY